VLLASELLQNLKDTGSRQCRDGSSRSAWVAATGTPDAQAGYSCGSAAGRVGYTTAAGWLTRLASWVLGFDAPKLRPARRGHATISEGPFPSPRRRSHGGVRLAGVLRVRRRDRIPLLRLLVLVLLLLLLLLALAHVADAPPDAAALRIAGGHQLKNLLCALLARPEPATAAISARA